MAYKRNSKSNRLKKNEEECYNDKSFRIFFKKQVHKWFQKDSFSQSQPHLQNQVQQFNLIAEQLIKMIREYLSSPQTKNMFKTSNTAFSRRRKLPFEKVIALLLMSENDSLNKRIENLFENDPLNQSLPTSSAFCQARTQINSDVFRVLQRKMITFFYQYSSQIDGVKKWHHRLLLAVDGSKFTVPVTTETKGAFNISTNQYSTTQVVQANVSVLYDVLNELCINAELKGHISETDLFIQDQIPHLIQDAIVILDRLYAAYIILATLIKKKNDFIIRCPISHSFRAVEEFRRSQDQESLISISVGRDARKRVQSARLPEVITVRAIKVQLDTGELEILLTSLLDCKKYPINLFKDLYFKRWLVETYYDRLKNRIDVERFTSKKLSGIYQDFYAAICVTILETVLNNGLELELAQKDDQKGRKYQYKINKTVAYQALRQSMGFLICSYGKSEKDFLVLFQEKCCRQRVPIRPGRKNPRLSRSLARQYRYQKYKRHNFA